LGKKADEVGAAADELVQSDDASGTKATAVARAVSQLLGEASKSGASTHVLQSAMNVADTAGKVIAAKRQKSDNVEALNNALKNDIEQLHEALKEDQNKPAGGAPPKTEATNPKKKDKDKVKKDKNKDKKKTASEAEQSPVPPPPAPAPAPVVAPAPAPPPPAPAPVPAPVSAPAPAPAPYYEEPAPQPVQYYEAPVSQPVETQYLEQNIPMRLPTIYQQATTIDPNLPTTHINVHASQLGLQGVQIMQQFAQARPAVVRTAAPVMYRGGVPQYRPGGFVRRF